MQWTTNKLERAVLIYAENGRGKSTLANMLYCLANENNQLLKTIDSNEQPQVSLLFNPNKKIDYLNGAWSGFYPDVIVFDEHFINNNVYSGMDVEGKHRLNLLEFVIGEQAVNAKNKIDELTGEIAQLTKNISDFKKQLQFHHGVMSLNDFINLPKKENAEQEISDYQTKIEQAKKIENIKLLTIPKELNNPIQVDLEYIGSILNKDIIKIEDSAEEIVLKHIKKHDNLIETWIDQGQKFITGEDCPLCGQSLDNSTLIAHYKLYFNKEYKQLKTDIDSLLVDVENKLNDSLVSILEKDAKSNDVVAKMWLSYVESEITFSIDFQEITNHFNLIKSKLVSLLKIKQAQPLEKVDFSEIKKEIQGLLNETKEPIEKYNISVVKYISSINTYKQSLESFSVQQLQGQIKTAELTQLRHRDDINELITLLNEKEGKKIEKSSLKEITRNTLDEELSQYLEKYGEEINGLLANFGANFTLSKVKHDYMSAGKPRLDYKITLRGNHVKSNNLSTTLSAGDKRTLAFAIFIAHLHHDTDISKKIIVIDDPICSLDMGRRNCTKRILCNVVEKAKQTIVLGHDAYFLRDIYNDLNALKDERKINLSSIEITRGNNGYSKFESCDLNSKCQSEYYKTYMLLENFVKNGCSGNQVTVALAIRPLLEGYLHRRFPAQISSNTLFGVIVANAKQATSDNPLSYLSHLIDEFNAINDYASDFHHNTINDSSIDDNQLLSFVRRTLTLIQKG